MASSEQQSIVKKLRAQREDAVATPFFSAVVASLSGSIATCYVADPTVTFSATVPATVTGIAPGSVVELIRKGDHPIIIARY